MENVTLRWFLPNCCLPSSVSQLFLSLIVAFIRFQEHGLWPQPKQKVRELRISRSSVHFEFETITVVNGYNIIPLPRLGAFLAVARVHVLGADQKRSGL